MRNTILGTGIVLLLASCSLLGQTAVTSTGATTGTLPVYTGTSTISNSVITQSSSNIGIGTTTPAAALDVNGGIDIGHDPVIVESTISVPSSGTYVIASGGRIHGIYTLTYEGPNRVQTVRIFVDANQFDVGSTFSILDNHSYSGVPVMSGFRLLLASNGSNIYLVMNVGSLSGSNPIHVQYVGSADYPYGGPGFGGTLAGNEVAAGFVGLAMVEGSVGIGTTAPSQSLEVNGNGQIDGTTIFVGPAGGLYYADSTNEVIAGPSGGGVYFAPVGVNGTHVSMSTGSMTLGGSGEPNATLIFPNGSVQTTAYTAGSGITQSNGNIAVSGNLQVSGNTTPNTPSQGGYIGWNALSGGFGETDFINNQGGGSGAFAFFNTPSTGTPRNLLMFLTGAGNLGIGTQSPGAKLEVNGSIKLTAGSSASLTFPDSSVQATAWNGWTFGGDYAESIDVTGDRAEYESGDVMAIDPNHRGNFVKTGASYSRLVAGVFSTKPGLIGRRANVPRPDKEAEVPLAMLGIVPTKVTAENGPIEPGDLLVSSSTPGYAMKGTDPSRLTGAVIGKALAPLATGSGTIEVLISLQ